MTTLATHNAHFAADSGNVTSAMTSSLSSSNHHSDGSNGINNSSNNLYYTAPTISFDDMSTREDFLLMLVSTVSGSIVQHKKQKRALTILQACGVQPEILDAADPSNAMVRDELCELSGMKKGQYPQFFLVQGDQTEFFADFAELEHMNEEGTLAEWLGLEIPVKKNNVGEPSEALPSSSNDMFYKRGKVSFDNYCDDGTETTHPETSHGGSSFDSHSVVHGHQPTVHIQHYFDRMDDDVEAEDVHFEQSQDKERKEGIHSMQVQTSALDEDDTLYSSQQNRGSPFRSHQGSPPESPRDDSIIDSHMTWSSQGQSPDQDAATQAKEICVDTVNEVVVSSHGGHGTVEDDSVFCNIEDSERRQLQNTAHNQSSKPDPSLHSLQSLLSCDESVDTTATASSIVTNSRMTSMDLELCISPSTDIHFLLTRNSDDTSRCTLTLSNRSMSYLPLAFKIQASKRHRYMIWPNVGVVKPQSTLSVSVFLMDEAKQSLLDSFQKLGPAAEFLCTDSLTIEWCGVPTDFCNQLSDDHDQDMETLLSYWNSCRKNEGWSSEQTHLRVRISVDDQGQENVHRLAAQNADYAGQSSSNRSNERLPQTLPLITNSSSLTSFEMDETNKMLQAEIENLRRKCEEMTAERYILEQQLEEARETQSPTRGGAIHKFQLQQTMRCGHCLKVFRSDANSLMAPIASQSCGHSICRNCCYRRSSNNRRSPKHSLSSDLLMCVGDMQSLSFDDDSCPICHAPSAFGGSQLHVNQSLCLVLKLLDN